MQASISGLYNPSSVPHNDHLITDDDAESEFAEEVDQLETESEHEEEAAPDSDPYEEISRSMGDSLLPADVVERIIDAEGELGESSSFAMCLADNVIPLCRRCHWRACDVEGGSLRSISGHCELLRPSLRLCKVAHRGVGRVHEQDHERR